MILWITRNYAKGYTSEEKEYLKRHPEDKIHYTELCLFEGRKPVYDPIRNQWFGHNPYTMENNMFPEVEEGRCIKFETKEI